MSGASLRGRTAWITGGGWNLGRGVAAALAEAGARVALSGRRVDLLEEAAGELRSRGAEALAVPVDATSPTAVEGACRRIEESLGPVDILAALAGGGAVAGQLDEIDADDWWRVIETNLRTAQLTARAVIGGMRERRSGSVLFCVGAGAAFPEAGTPLSAYAAANAALCRLTDQLAVDLMDAGVRVNTLEPGNVGSPGDAHNAEAVSAAADLARWLVSDESAPLTGRTVSVHDAWWRDRAQVERVAASHHLACLRRIDPAQE